MGKQHFVVELRKKEGKSVWQIKAGSFIIGDKPAHDKKPKIVRHLDQISRYLAQQLLEPIKDRLYSKKRWIISPDGALALIPFENLILEKQPVIATHHVSYVQSLSILALLKQREELYQSLENRGTLLAMGAARYELQGKSIDRQACNKAKRAPNFDIETMLTRNQADPQRYQRAFKALDITWCNLPRAEQELAALEQLFEDKQTLILKKDQATELKLQSLNQNGILTRYRYLLFSAHGYLSPDAPALSAIVLGQLNNTANIDGFVTASEWPSYDLKSDLMVLSACQTGVGKLMRGEGVMGLPYAFYVAGNKNTLMTLWSVLDDSTAKFITSFFEKLKNGMAQVDALTATKREFLNSKQYKRPLYWAPFVLYGI